MTRGPDGLGPLMINFRGKLTWLKTELLVAVSQNPNLFGWSPDVPWKCTFWLAETRENICTGHKTKLSGHRTRQKEKKTKTSYNVLHRGHTANFVYTYAGLIKTVHSSVCEAGLNSSS